MIWKTTAEQQLAEIYLRAPDRPQVILTTDHIVKSLSEGPSEQGESRAGQDRIIIESPLADSFRVDERSKTVLVLRVSQFERLSN